MSTPSAAGSRSRWNMKACVGPAQARCGRFLCGLVPWVPAFAGMTFVGRYVLSTGVIPAEAGTQPTSQRAYGSFWKAVSWQRCAQAVSVERRTRDAAMCCCGCGLIVLSQVQGEQGALAQDQGGHRPRAGRLRGVLRRLMRRLRLLHGRALVMIEKFAGVRDMVGSEFLDLNHTSKPMILVSLVIPKFARDAGGKGGRTSESGH